MKRFLVVLLLLVGLAVNAKDVSLNVLPLFMSSSFGSNSYGFLTTSEIVAGDIIHEMMGRCVFTTSKLSDVKSTVEKDAVFSSVVDGYKRAKLLDVEKLVSISRKSLLEQTLVVISYIEDRAGAVCDCWDVLKLSSDFEIDYPYILTTRVILLDNKDGIALWQKTYNMNLTSGKVSFVAYDEKKAYEFYEKIRSYSANIIAKDVVQNLERRLKNKTIDYSKKVTKNADGNSGIGLKYYKNRTIPTVKITQPEESFEQHLLKEDLFGL